MLNRRNDVTLVRRFVPAACLLLSLLAFGVGSLVADTVPDNQIEPPARYTADELEALVGPVALYPDDLVAIVLPAAAFPIQIVEAARFLKALEEDPDLEPDADWDDAVVALLNYPEIIELMNEDLQWTWRLGEAFVYQQGDLLQAIQDFRGHAYAAGNLKTDDHQVITDVSGSISIEPVEPERVVVYQPYPVYRYHPVARPLYYYPHERSIWFNNGFFFGVATAYHLGWGPRRLHVYHHWHPLHPYHYRPYAGYRYLRYGGFRQRQPVPARGRGFAKPVVETPEWVPPVRHAGNKSWQRARRKIVDRQIDRLRDGAGKTALPITGGHTRKRRPGTTSEVPGAARAPVARSPVPSSAGAGHSLKPTRRGAPDRSAGKSALTGTDARPALRVTRPSRPRQATRPSLPAEANRPAVRTRPKSSARDVTRRGVPGQSARPSVRVQQGSVTRLRANTKVRPAAPRTTARPKARTPQRQASTPRPTAAAPRKPHQPAASTKRPVFDRANVAKPR